MSLQQVRLDHWRDQHGTTTDPRKHDNHNPWSGIPTHLTVNPASRVAPDLEVDRSRGLFYCQDCDRRITRNTQNHKEYGHDTDCQHHEFAEVIRQ